MRRAGGVGFRGRRAFRRLGVVGVDLEDVGVDFVEEADVAAAVFQIVGLLFLISAVHADVAVNVLELGFVGAVAFLVFLTVGQTDAVVVVEVVAEFGEVAVLFQTTATVDIAVAVFVVAVVEEVACKQGIEAVLIAVNRRIAG